MRRRWARTCFPAVAARCQRSSSLLPQPLGGRRFARQQHFAPASASSPDAPRDAVPTLAAITREVARADARAIIAAGVRLAIASRLAAAAARPTLSSSSPLPHASPPLVALRELTSAGSLPDCAPLLRCLR